MKKAHSLLRAGALGSSILLVAGYVAFRTGAVSVPLPGESRLASPREDRIQRFFDCGIDNSSEESVQPADPFMIKSTAATGTEPSFFEFAFDLIPTPISNPIAMAESHPVTMSGSKAMVFAWTPPGSGLKDIKPLAIGQRAPLEASNMPVDKESSPSHESLFPDAEDADIFVIKTKFNDDLESETDARFFGNSFELNPDYSDAEPSTFLGIKASR